MSKRYESENIVNKECGLCPGILEDKTHFLFHCPLYSSIRHKHSRIHGPERTVYSQRSAGGSIRTYFQESSHACLLCFKAQRRKRYVSKWVQGGMCYSNFAVVDKLWTVDTMNVRPLYIYIYIYIYIKYLRPLCVWVGGLHNKLCVNGQSLSLSMSLSLSLSLSPPPPPPPPPWNSDLYLSYFADFVCCEDLDSKTFLLCS